jgi:ribonuclease T1
MSFARRTGVAFAAIVTMVIVGLLGAVDASASTPTLVHAGTRVGVIDIASGQVVGAHPDVLPGQCRARAPGYDLAAVGSCVAAETEAGAGAGLPFHDAVLEGRVTQTLDDIEAGVTRYPQDGTVFQNREGLLPKEGAGYYTEYTVENPAYTNRGVERLVVGSNGEVYYTPDHYGSFVRIR